MWRRQMGMCVPAALSCWADGGPASTRRLHELRMLRGDLREMQIDAEEAEAAWVRNEEAQGMPAKANDAA